MINYIPDAFKDVREFKVGSAVWTDEYNAIWGGMDAIRANQYVDTLDDYGCTRNEKMYGLVKKDTDTLAVRRFRIKAKKNEQPPYTYNIVKGQIENLCSADGYSFSVDHANHIIAVRVALTAKGMYDEIENLLLRVRPANMVIDLSLLYNQWIVLAAKTWAELSGTTWHQARNEVI
jgi:hypothetical protein